MTAQETIAAAIQRLESIRLISANAWRAGGHSLAALTLRRTVEPQLQILRQALAELEPFNGVRLNDDAVQRELALARAILGDLS